MERPPVPPLVAVVTRDPGFREAAHAALDAAGFRVGVAGDLDALQRQVVAGSPMVALIALEGMHRDGFAACRGVFCDEQNGPLPVLIVLDESEREHVQAAYEAGACDCVLHPVDWPQITARLRGLVSMRGFLGDLHRSKILLDQAQRIAHLGVWEWDPMSSEMWWSDGTFRTLGFEPGTAECTFESFTLCMHPADRPRMGALLSRALEAGEPFAAMHRVVHSNGGVRHVRTQGQTTGDIRAGSRRVLGVTQDITAERRQQERIQFLAHYDSLTGLANRQRFRDRLGAACDHAEEREGRMALLYLDLDEFKRINDTLGHGAGDRLLQRVGELLIDRVRLDDMVSRDIDADPEVSRLGGDEFAILVSDIKEPGDAGLVASRILSALSNPMEIDGHEISTRASIGIAIYPDDGADTETLVKHADTALYHAKEIGRNNYQFFTETMMQWQMRRLTVEEELRHAIERDELFVLYQPRVDLATGRVLSAEALLRWRNPALGMVQPSEFVRVAEETGLISGIGNWVLREACAQMRRWADEGLGLRMSVNVSPRQLAQQDFRRCVSDALRSAGADPRLLELEITESAVLKDFEATALLLNELRAMGVSVALDDFGTGYSSLSYLVRFPLDVLKLDRSFVRNLGVDPTSGAIATSVIAVAHSLGLAVVAEGVDAIEQVHALRERRCDELQGFLVSPAVDPEACAQLYRNPPTLDGPKEESG